MTKLTGIDPKTTDVNCYEQLSSLDCQSDECPLVQLRENSEQPELRKEDRELIVTEVEAELPSGETKHFSTVLEAVCGPSGETKRVIQSFVEMGFDYHQTVSSNISVPEPKDASSFRKALTKILKQAASNGMDISDRSWESPRKQSSPKWDVEIYSIATGDEEN